MFTSPSGPSGAGLAVLDEVVGAYTTSGVVSGIGTEHGCRPCSPLSCLTAYWASEISCTHILAYNPIVLAKSNDR